MNNSLTSSRYPEIDRMLVEGKLEGPHGALETAYNLLFKKTQRGDIEAMMKLANVYFTAVGAFGSRGLGGKLNAVKYLHWAKLFATKAFLTQFQTKSLESALARMDVASTEKGRTPFSLEYGHVHILMSCYAQWAKQIKARIPLLGMGKEKAIVRSCYMILRRSGVPETLQTLATSTMMEFPGIDTKTREDCTKRLQMFIDKRYTSLMNEPDIKSVDAGLVQAVCRVLRALKKFDAAIPLAEKYGLTDQANKARSRI